MRSSRQCGVIVGVQLACWSETYASRGQNWCQDRVGLIGVTDPKDLGLVGLGRVSEQPCLPCDVVSGRWTLENFSFHGQVICTNIIHVIRLDC